MTEPKDQPRIVAEPGDLFELALRMPDDEARRKALLDVVHAYPAAVEADEGRRR